MRVGEIISYVGENQFNLIAMTTNAACGIGIWPIGSVADKVSTEPLALSCW